MSMETAAIHFQEVHIGRMERKVSLLDTVGERGEILQEFRQRCKQFVKTSVEWAPDTVQSHLQEYINEITKESFSFHMGVNLASECVQTFSVAPNADSVLGGGGGSGGSYGSMSSVRQVRLPAAMVSQHLSCISVKPRVSTVRLTS